MRGPDARPVSEDAMPPPPRSRLRALELWIVGHAPQIWPAIVVVAVAALSWHVIGSLEPRRIAAAMGGVDRRYADFNLGMAPLATVGEARTAHFPERLARILFRYGESWYNFRGLREYKSKFQPRWQPRYLAYSRTWEWPRLVAHVSALIAGGWRTVAHLPARDDASGRAGAGVDRVSTVADASLELALETTTGSSAAGATRAERGGLAR